jgi:hypothetical protein
MADHNSIQRHDTTPPPPSDRAAKTNERKSHLRSLAVAGTLASVGAFTALAASNTHVASTAAPAASEQQGQDPTQSQTQQGLDDGFTQSPDNAGVVPSTDDYFDQGQAGQDSSGSQGGTVAPPQPGMGPGGSAPSMSGGS